MEWDRCLSPDDYTDLSYLLEGVCVGDRGRWRGRWRVASAVSRAVSWEDVVEGHASWRVDSGGGVDGVDLFV